jgi:hypothetical protein
MSDWEMRKLAAIMFTDMVGLPSRPFLNQRLGAKDRE